MGTLNDTPGAVRTHIAFFGKMNSGKSSLINALTGQQTSIVSDIAGTTTDLVKKPMEIAGIGPCVLLDTAGFDDEGPLGESRLEQTRQAVKQAELAVLVCTGDELELEKQWYGMLCEQNTPTAIVVNKSDLLGLPASALAKNASDGTANPAEQPGQESLPASAAVKNAADIAANIKQQLGQEPLLVSAATGAGVDRLKEKLVQLAAGREAERDITGGLVAEDDLVLLVMPQDPQAPKGRLILPQAQTIRELLDKKCLTMSVTTDKLDQALAVLKRPPKLIITDSQAFGTVYEKKPAQSRLTSFSALFAAYKGDIRYYADGAQAIGALKETDRVLIAECCTHAPLDEDIGRVKLPRLLKKRIGAGLRTEVVSGTDFPEDLSAYAVVIQCGACMFHRKYVMSRVEAAKRQGIPMTNYGIAIAYLNGILDKIELPGI